MLTGFGIYLVIYMVVNIVFALVAGLLGEGYHATPGSLIFGALWMAFNLWGLFHWGFYV